MAAAVKVENKSALREQAPAGARLSAGAAGAAAEVAEAGAPAGIDRPGRSGSRRQRRQLTGRQLRGAQQLVLAPIKGHSSSKASHITAPNGGTVCEARASGSGCARGRSHSCGSGHCRPQEVPWMWLVRWGRVLSSLDRRVDGVRGGVGGWRPCMDQAGRCTEVRSAIRARRGRRRGHGNGNGYKQQLLMQEVPATGQRSTCTLLLTHYIRPCQQPRREPLRSLTPSHSLEPPSYLLTPPIPKRTPTATMPARPLAWPTRYCAVDKISGFSLGGTDSTCGPVALRAPSTWRARATGRTSRGCTCMEGGAGSRGGDVWEEAACSTFINLQ